MFLTLYSLLRASEVVIDPTVLSVERMWLFESRKRKSLPWRGDRTSQNKKRSGDMEG